MSLFCILFPGFSAAQQRYDVLITEFLPDPSPGVGLPESEFIELTNHSANDYNLRNWKISNGNTTAVIKTDYILKADSFLILCNPSATDEYQLFGSTLGITSFPSLNNESGEIILSTETGRVIHALQYHKTWFKNELKAGGGWSLEMIDLSNAALGKPNWTASNNSTGGTPGAKNSADAVNPDVQSPSVVHATTTDSLHLILFFDEPVDSLSAANLSAYLFSEGILPPDSAYAMPPLFDRVYLHLQNPFRRATTYTVTVRDIADCSGNEISLYNTCKAGLPEKPEPGDINFNEILFNPPSGGSDYLELYNRSRKNINCRELFIAGKEISGSLKDPVSVEKEERIFFPGEYLLLTENSDWVLENFPLSNAGNMISMSSLPSLPDDQGQVVLLNPSGETIDELDYDHHWHSPLLANENGVALEKLSPELSGSQASGWTSAAASAGYGTPGYKNSESLPDSTGSDFISIDPKIFSPDMDGYQDFCFIHFQLPSPGFMGSISVYDISGRMVRKLVNNTIWGDQGVFRWDGLDDEQNLLPMGHYVMYIELFRPEDGTMLKRKLVCTLARRY